MYFVDNKENLTIIDGANCHKNLMIEMDEVSNFISKNNVDPILIKKINNLAENINCINNSISDTNNNVNLLGSNMSNLIMDYSNNKDVLNKLVN